MDHDAIQAQLFSFYDGELAGDVRRTIETHLQGCAECRMLVAQWTRVAGRLFQAPAIQPSEAFVERTTRRIASTRPQPVRISRWLADRGWLIPAMGVNGAALASAIAYSVAILGGLVVFARSEHLGARDIFRFGAAEVEDYRTLVRRLRGIVVRA